MKLIKKYEGFEENAYLCPAGVWTIGYGFTTLNGRPVKEGDKITRADADYLLQDKVNWYSDKVRQSVKKDLTENQLEALVSFTFNVGLTAFKSSSLLRKINGNGDISYHGQMNPKAIDFYVSNGVTEYTEFHRWFNVNGAWRGKQGSEGLARRRMAESDLYLGKCEVQG